MLCNLCDEVFKTQRDALESCWWASGSQKCRLCYLLME